MSKYQTLSEDQKARIAAVLAQVRFDRFLTGHVFDQRGAAAGTHQLLPHPWPCARPAPTDPQNPLRPLTSTPHSPSPA
jgi:hypothetical protein